MKLTIYLLFLMLLVTQQFIRAEDRLVPISCDNFFVLIKVFTFVLLLYLGHMENLTGVVRYLLRTTKFNFF